MIEITVRRPACVRIMDKRKNGRLLAKVLSGCSMSHPTPGRVALVQISPRWQTWDVSP